MQGLGKLLDGGGGTKKKNPDDAKLEGLVGDLIGALKTDAGKRDFERLAAAQNSEEDLAAKSPFPGFVARPPGERKSFSGRGPASGRGQRAAGLRRGCSRPIGVHAGGGGGGEGRVAPVFLFVARAGIGTLPDDADWIDSQLATEQLSVIRH